MAELKNNIFNNNIAGDTSNILIPDTSAIKSGIVFKANIDSNVLNGYYNLLSEAVQFLQFTGGLYDENADYDEGNIASLVIKNGEDYSIWQFRRNANNPQVLNNNPPISGASITTVNGVDAYEGGSLNTDWDKLTEDYAVEATANTVMGRDSEGASNVNMPSSVTDTSIVNNEYLQQQLQTQLQAGLATKQDTLTAGTNITIEDNVISASGDLATRAELVSYDNSNTNLQYMTGYDFPKFKIPIPDTINFVLTDVNSTTDYPAAITKQSDGSYILNASLSNVQSLFRTKAILLVLKSVEETTDQLQMLNMINMFWQVVSGDNWTVNNGDISIEGVDDALQFEFLQGNLYISKTDLSDFVQEPYNITLSIKNRRFHNLDTYFLGIGNYSNTNFLSYLNLQNNSGSVKLVGTIKGTGSSYFETVSSYSFLMTLGSYFNLASSGSYTNTTEITSSTGKAVKYYFTTNASDTNAIDLVIAYQDGSTISNDDIFTLNLTPDLNATVDPIYSEVTNVQELGESLNEKIDSNFNNLNIIADGEEHPTGTYYQNADGGKKPIYYRLYLNVQLRGALNQSNEWNIDEFILKNNYIYYNNDRYASFLFWSSDSNATSITLHTQTKVIKFRTLFSPVGSFYIEYTKTTDSYEY